MDNRKQDQGKLGELSDLMHDMEQEKEVCLLYGNLITKILEHTRFNFGEEEFIKNKTKIGQSF